VAALRMIDRAVALDMSVMGMDRSSPLRPPSLTTLRHPCPILLLPSGPKASRSKSSPSRGLTPPAHSSMRRAMTGPHLRTKMVKAQVQTILMTRDLDDQGPHRANFSSRLSQRLLTYQAPVDKMPLGISDWTSVYRHF